MNSKILKHFLNTLFFILSVIVLLFIAIKNGYPILFIDDGTYIISGIEEFVPIDRPIFYGLFIRHISLFYSLWFVIFAQSIIVVYILLLVYKHLFNAKYVFAKTFITSVLLTLTTGISYFTGQILPDIFAPVLFLGIALILSKKKLPLKTLIPLSIIIVFSIIVHLAHLVTSLGLVVFFAVFFLIFIKKDFFKQRIKKLVIIVLLIGVSWLIVPSVNYWLGAEFKLARAPNVIYLSNLIRAGILNDYLEENCNEKQYDLCNYLDEISDNAQFFVWNMKKSPLYSGGCKKEGWTNCWVSKNEEFGKIINDVLKIPKYRNKIIKIEINYVLEQIFTFYIEERSPQKIVGNPSHLIKKYFHADIKHHISSNQYENTLLFEKLSLVQYIIVIISIIALILIFSVKKIRKKIPNNIKLFTFIIIIAILGNAATTGIFSSPVPRYQARVIWMLPMLVIMILMNLNKFKIIKKTNLKIKNFF